MKILAHQNANTTKIAITGAAAQLFELMDTAGGTDTEVFYSGRANAVTIIPEDGDIRVSFEGIIPTSLLGALLVSGVPYVIPNIKLEQLRLISVGGGSVNCSVIIAKTEGEEAFLGNGSPGAGATSLVSLSGQATSGGTNKYKNIDVDESEDEVKATAGQVYWLHVINLSVAPLYLKFFDAPAASVTVGTTVPDLTFTIPSQGDTNGAGFNLAIPNGIEFTSGITVAATTGVADNDSGAPGLNEVILNLGYA